MKEEKLLDALGKIEDELVLEAAPERAVLKTVQAKEMACTRNKGNRKQRAWVKWTAMAACVCLLAGAGTLGWVYSNGRDMPVDEVASDVAREEIAARDDVLTIPNAEEQDQNTTVQDDLTTQDTALTGDEGFPNWGLALSAKNVTPSGLTLVCTQSGGEPTGDIMTGEDYYLIVLKDETWKTVSPVIENYGWNSLAHWILKDTDTEFEIDWKWLYGELEPGTYRLVKEFMDFRKTADYDKAVYWMEFVIE